MQTDPVTIATHTLTRHTRNTQVIFNATPIEKAAIKQVSREMGFTTSAAWLRYLISEGLRAAAQKRNASSEAA